MSTINASFQLILDTTEALIREKGCRQTTLQDIITRSGLSKGAIYHYVSGKDELLGHVLKARVEEMNARFREAVARPETRGLQEPLQAIAEGLVRNTAPDDVTNKIFFYMLGQMDNEKVARTVRDMYRYTVETGAAWVREGQRHGVIPPEADADRLARSLTRFMYGMRVQHTIEEEPEPVTIQDVTRLLAMALG